jgi:hypothetical protein
MNVQFIASISMIVREGSKHFGLWPLRQAAESCCGTSDGPADRPVPHVRVEFEVEEDRP